MQKLPTILSALAAVGGMAAALLTLWGQAHYVSREEAQQEQKANLVAHQSMLTSIEDVRRTTAILLDRAERKAN